MFRRTFVATAAALAGSFAVGIPHAHAESLDDVLGAITKARAGLKTLIAPFQQVRKIGLLAAEVKSDGEMTLVRPDRLRWELKPPDGITYWITPEGFAYRTEKGGVDAGKGAAGRFGAVLGDLMTMLGGDLATLKSRYELSARRDGDQVTIGAKPLAEDVKKHVKRLELTAGPELWRVKGIRIEEKNGDRSDITFSSVKRDESVPPEKMRPPKDS